MSDALPNYVSENYAKAIKMDLNTWIARNPLPAIVEPKFDGIRVFLFKSGENLVISGKLGTVFTPKVNPTVFAKIPELVRAPRRAIIDGEYVAGDGLHLFDILQTDDKNLRSLALTERKKVLHEILDGTDLEVEYKFANSPQEILQIKQELVDKDREGVIVKNPMSRYGQSNSWLKLKRYDTIDCFVTGYEETQEKIRTGIPRSWFIGVYDEHGQVVDLGKVGSFRENVDPGLVKIDSVIEVRFQNLTEDHKLRAPFILRIRHDKKPSECFFSQFYPSGSKEKLSAEVTVNQTGP
jgi:ATP-dependent DNA ligase